MSDHAKVTIGTGSGMSGSDTSFEDGSPALGIVYILVNPAMPHVIKIGRAKDLASRLRALDNTSTPLPFQCFFAARVSDMAEAERLMHEAFGDDRVRANREFFRTRPDRARAALKLGMVEDVTPRKAFSNDAEGLDALRREQMRNSARAAVSGFEGLLEDRDSSVSTAFLSALIDDEEEDEFEDATLPGWRMSHFDGHLSETPGA